MIRSTGEMMSFAPQTMRFSAKMICSASEIMSFLAAMSHFAAETIRWRAKTQRFAPETMRLAGGMCGCLWCVMVSISYTNAVRETKRVFIGFHFEIQ